MATVRDPRLPRTGVVLGVYPSSEPLDIELQRMTTASTFAPIAHLSHQSGLPFQYIDHLALTTAVYSYRARHVGLGFGPGAWTDTVSASPAVFQNARFASPPVSGKGLEVDVWVGSAASIKVGSKGSSGTVTKTIRFPATIYRPLSAAHNYSYGLGTLIPGSSTGTFSYRAAYVFPKNVNLTKFSVAGLRTGSASTCTLKLYRVSTAATATLVTTITGTVGAGGFAIDSSALSEAVDDANYWIGDLTMLSSAGTNAAHLKYTEFTYTIDDYQTAY